MRILRTIASINPEVGGPVEGTLNSSRELIRQGHEVEIVSLDDPNAPYIKNFPLTLHTVGPAYSFYWYTPHYKQWILKNIENYDCVIIQGIWRYNSIATRYACLQKNIPYFVFTHGQLDPWFKKKYLLKHLKKWLFWPWGDYRVLRDANAVFFTTDEERQLAKLSFWLYSARERVVGYGIKGSVGNEDEQRAAFHEAYPELLGKPFFLFLSRIHTKKGCDLLIKAFAEITEKYPSWLLVLAGPDQIGLRSDLEILCKKLNITDKVIWLGMISGDIKWGAFHTCEAFILPSHSENFGIVVAEALSCNSPVLISNKVNIWREVKKYEAGLVEADTLEGTKKLLLDFIHLPKNEKSKMKKNALTCFNEQFGIEKAVKNLVNGIKSTLCLSSSEHRKG